MKDVFMLLLMISLFNLTSCRKLNFQEKNKNLIIKLAVNLKLEKQYSNETADSEGIQYHYLKDRRNINSLKVIFSENKEKAHNYFNKAVSSIPVTRQVILGTSEPSKLQKKGLFDDFVIFDCEDKNEIDCSVTFIGYYRNYVFKIYGEKAFFDNSFKMISKELNQIYTN